MEMGAPAEEVDGVTPPLTPERLCADYATRVYRFAAMVAKGDVEAEDLAQEALVRAIQRITQFDPGRGDLDGWLWRIVVNAARDAGRISARRLALLERLRSTPSQADAVETLALKRLSDRELLDAVRQLPKRERAVIALRYGADLDYSSVGRLLGLSVGAATMATHRALAKLRIQLEAEKQ
jgi:RNA polymerase sigma-70 factor (ECF subfamily)